MVILLQKPFYIIIIIMLISISMNIKIKCSAEEKMLETSEERIKLLKTGFMQKQIEEMYIEGNDFKIVSLPILVDILEIEAGQNKNICKNAVESAQSLSSAVVCIFNRSGFGSCSPIIH